MSDYHPSQKILAEHEALYSQAIRESLRSELTMVAQLDNSESFQPSSLPVTEHLPPLNFDQKLGHLYEDALAQILEQSTRYTLIAKNQQIITSERKTIGELDYVLLDKQSDLHLQVELAIKFYLVHQEGYHFKFPGPDARDNYHNKLNRLSSHQLQLTRQDATRELLRKQFEIHQIKPSHLIQGIFFDHIHAEDHPSPPSANLFCRRRSWLHCRELHSHLPKLSTARVLPKALWICEMTEELFDTLVEVSAAELTDLGQQRCTMFVQSATDQPIFLAPDRWPEVH